MINILEVYKQASSQKVNKNKTAMFFSKYTSEATKQAIKIAMGIKEIIEYKKYLALHSWLEGEKRRVSTT